MNYKEVEVWLEGIRAKQLNIVKRYKSIEKLEADEQEIRELNISRETDSVISNSKISNTTQSKAIKVVGGGYSEKITNHKKIIEESKMYIDAQYFTIECMYMDDILSEKELDIINLLYFDCIDVCDISIGKGYSSRWVYKTRRSAIEKMRKNIGIYM